jgi:hypothetical protein
LRNIVSSRKASSGKTALQVKKNREEFLKVRERARIKVTFKGVGQNFQTE